MPRNFIAFLQLIRLPNIFTAAADSLAGWLLVAGSLADPIRWLPLILASMVLYASGTALNDVFDLEVDRQERPNRPLPSGRVSWMAAAWLGGLGLMLGPALALASGSWASAIVAIILAVCILSYDAGIKHTRVGPVFMATCRGLNLLLGMSHAPEFAGPPGWIAAASYGLFVAGITLISRTEAYGGRGKAFLTGLALQDLALASMMINVLAFQSEFPSKDHPWFLLVGTLVLALAAFAINHAAVRAYKEPTPALIQETVKMGILSLVWINVALVGSFHGPMLAAVVAAFWFPAFLLARWLYAT